MVYLIRKSFFRDPEISQISSQLIGVEIDEEIHGLYTNPSFNDPETEYTIVKREFSVGDLDLFLSSFIEKGEGVVALEEEEYFEFELEVEHENKYRKS